MYSKIKQFLDAAPKTLKSANEIYNFARNAYKKAMGFFPDGIDDIFLKRGSAEMQDVRNKVVKFPEGGKDKTDFFSTRPDPRVKQPEGAKMDVQRAHENLAGGSNYAQGDTKYNADVLADEIARQRKLIPDDGIADSSDLDFKTKTDLYDEAYSYLTGLRMLNRKPKQGGLMSTIEGETKMRSPEEIMEFLMKGGKGADTNIGKAPKTTKTKPDVDPVLQQSEDQKQMFLDFGKRTETEAETIARMNKQNKDAVKRLKEKKEKDLGDKLKDFDGDPDAMAQGGRIGFSGGGAGFAGNQMEGDQYTMGQQIPGSPQVPMGQFGSVNVGIFGGGGYSKNQIVPGVDMATTNQNYGITGQIPIGNTGFTIGGDYMKSRANERFTGEAIPGQTFKNVPSDSDRFNVGINFRKQFKDGSKPPNPGRRNFMKLMAGLASLPVVGKLFKGAKVADKVVQLKNTTTTMPAWFPKFVDRFISKGVGRKVDQDLMQYETKDLPGVKLEVKTDGKIRVEGQNAYNEPYVIDYEPPGYEVVDYSTGKAVKTKGEFAAADTQYFRTGDPREMDYDVDYNKVKDLDDLLGGNSTKLEGFAKGTNKEKYTKGQRAVDEADSRADVYEGPDVDMSDYEDFAKGGLAYMLGE
jgi:hypothetical protein